MKAAAGMAPPFLSKCKATLSLIILGVTMGCQGGRPVACPPADVDVEVAATALISEYDQDQGGTLDARELASVPAISRGFMSFDLNGDTVLDETEIATRLNHLYGTAVALIKVQCTTTLSGRPLQGATVKFRPLACLGESVEEAQGITGPDGVTQPSIPNDVLPERMRGVPLMRPGLYTVEIVHPHVVLPAKYNTSSELGCEIDPSSRTGAMVAFDLKP